MPRNRQFPIIFEMTHPVSRLQHRWSVADRRVGQPDAVGRLAIAYLLLEPRVGEEQRPWRCRGIELDRVSLHRLGDVLEILSAEFTKGYIELALDLIQHLARDADSAAIGNTFEPSRDVNPVPEDVRAFANDVAKIDANAKFDALVRRYRRIAFEHAALNLDGTSNGIHDAAKFSENTVARGVSDVAAMLLDQTIEELAPMSP